MAEYKCGDCFHAELCEKSEMLVGFSRDNPAYCGMFLNSADVAPVRRGRWLPQVVLGQKAWDCSECKTLGSPQWKWCPVCGAKMDGGAGNGCQGKAD